MRKIFAISFILAGIIIGLGIQEIIDDRAVYNIDFYGRGGKDILQFRLYTGKDPQIADAGRCLKRLNDLVLFKDGKPIAGKVLCGEVLEIKEGNY